MKRLWSFKPSAGAGVAPLLAVINVCEIDEWGKPLAKPTTKGMTQFLPTTFVV